MACVSVTVPLGLKAASSVKTKGGMLVVTIHGPTILPSSLRSSALGLGIEPNSASDTIYAAATYNPGLRMVILLGVHLLDHLIRLQQHRLRDRQAQRLSGLEVDHQFERGRLLHGQVTGLGTLEDPVDISSRAASQIRETRAVRYQATRVDALSIEPASGQSIPHREIVDTSAVGIEERITRDDKSPGVRSLHQHERVFEFFTATDDGWNEFHIQFPSGLI